MLDKNSVKILKFLIKHPNGISFETISSKFKSFSNLQLIDILNTLCKEQYIRNIDLQTYVVLNKGSTYKDSSIKSWLLQNIIAILALIVSICAFIRTL